MLSTGAFNTNMPVEPMSDYKWCQLLNLSCAKNVSDIINKGIIQTAATDRSLVPQSISANVQSAGTTVTRQEQLKPVSWTKAKKFQCPILNKRYNRIVFNERHSIDTSVESIELLDLIIDNSQNILCSNLDIRKIVDLGMFLRKEGDKTDFVKVDKWLSVLKMKKISNLIGSYLIILCGFEKDEIPFMKKYRKRLCNKTYKALSKYFSYREEVQNTADEDDEDVSYKVEWGSLKYLATFPTEAASVFTLSIIKSLSNIEE